MRPKYDRRTPERIYKSFGRGCETLKTPKIFDIHFYNYLTLFQILICILYSTERQGSVEFHSWR